jgi:hypothetical protein
MAKEGAGKGSLLSLICQDFLSNHRASDEPKKALKEMLAKIEATTGLSLVALDRNNQRIFYGMDTLKELAGGGTGGYSEEAGPQLQQ